MTLKAVHDTDFDSLVLDSDTPVLVDFWADWCAPCRQLRPIVEELSKTYEGRVAFYELDTNANVDVPSRFGVLNLPTVLLFKGGEVVKEIKGSVTKMTLRKTLDEVV